MKINFVIPNIGPRFTGGTLCIFEYANELTKMGHKVTIVPLVDNGDPYKFTLNAEIIGRKGAGRITKTWRKDNVKNLIRAKVGSKAYDSIRNIKKSIDNVIFPLKSKNEERNYLDQLFNSLARALKLISECDINIATAYETALPVYLSGKGIKPFYFMQHFEEIFSIDMPIPQFSQRSAALSYMLPLHRIANSIWLKQTIESRYPSKYPVNVVTNAIRTEVFYPRKSEKKDLSKIRVISYGGRSAIWKGFSDAVDAMKIVKEKYSSVEWIVYGGALIPPDNKKAPYTDAGYLSSKALAKLYSTGDIMLCPAWYESFPLYPLEAMACGLAVVTTPFGTEDYATHEKNCLLVPPKQPEEMAKAIIKLIENPNLRKKLAALGMENAKQFTWEKSARKMEKIFIDSLSGRNNA